MDPQSIENYKYACSSLLGFINNSHCPPVPESIKKNRLLWDRDITLRYSTVNIEGLGWKLPEVFYFEHSLRFAHKKILDYVKERDIMDVGAFIGDSAFILQNRTNHRVFSYEFSPGNIETFRKNAKTLHFDPKKNILVQKGISGKKETLHVKKCNKLSCNIYQKGKIPIYISTIDSEVEENNITLGFFKADVEGAGLDLMKGALKSILKFRPVFDVSIYHSSDELFGIPEFVQNLPNYEYEFHSGNDYPGTFGEISLFGYPKEILFNNNTKLHSFVKKV